MPPAVYYVPKRRKISYGERTRYFSSTEMYNLESFDLKISIEVLTAKAIAVIFDSCLFSSRLGENLTPDT